MAILQPNLSLLDRKSCLHIHQASCEILQHTGFRVFNQAALDILGAAGARIEANLVHVSPSLVEWALASVPSCFNLYTRGSQEVALELNGEKAYFGPGSDTLHYLDPRTGSRRDFQLADLADCVHVADALPEINFVMSMGVPKDVPTRMHYRHQFAIMLRHSTKPIVFVCHDQADIEAIATMAAAAAGGEQRLRARPNILLYSEPSSPLQHAQEATDKLLFCAKYKIPVTHSPAPMMGGTAPITLPGAIALGNAEVLSSLVMHQLNNPGAPFLYGHGVHHIDMQTMVSVYGAPEFQLARMMAAEMARFYNLPLWGYAGHSDSKVVDGQAAIDAQFSTLVALLAVTNLNHDVGYLESGLTHSPEMMVLTDEIISMNRRFISGTRLDAENLALDVIHEVGPGGDFMSHDHTFTHFRELWIPRIFDRQQFPNWESSGAKDLNMRLKERTLALMEDHTVPALSSSVENDIELIMKKD
ncbi:MAG: trimethylamine methyltransferase family protein [Anaerolineales bacterium]